jgi:uncharacterized protein YifN (PemK superfamily)
MSSIQYVIAWIKQDHINTTQTDRVKKFGSLTEARRYINISVYDDMRRVIVKIVVNLIDLVN